MIEPRTNPIHLYRALLRECSYLPDPHARTFFHDYTISYFRRYLPKHPSCRADIPLGQQVRLLRRGRKELSVLRRANEGYVKPLEKVLMISYGRTGKRRHQILDQLMRIENAPTGRELGEPKPSTSPTEKWTLSPLIQALLRSQAGHRGQLERSKIRIKLKPQIPEQTIWRKKPSRRRIENAMKQWYTKLIDSVLPPLPEKEWKELHRKATGTSPWPGPIKRRTKILKPDTLSTPIQRSKVLLEGPEKGDTFRRYIHGRPHQITPRLMQHLWAVVLRHTPMITWDSANNKMIVHWDSLTKASPKVSIPSPEQANRLFGS